MYHCRRLTVPAQLRAKHHPQASLHVQMQPLHAAPHACALPCRAPLRANPPPLLSQACAAASHRLRADHGGRRPRVLPHHMVLRLPLLHRDAEPSLSRADGRGGDARAPLARCAGMSALHMCGVGRLMERRCLARGRQLHVPPEQHRLGALCVCVEPAYGAAIPPCAAWRETAREAA